MSNPYTSKNNMISYCLACYPLTVLKRCCDTFTGYQKRDTPFTIKVVRGT